MQVKKKKQRKIKVNTPFLLGLVFLISIGISFVALRKITSLDLDSASDDMFTRDSPERWEGGAAKQPRASKVEQLSKKKKFPSEAKGSHPMGFGGRKYHMVFSTSCDSFQDWQSFVFFYWAKKVKQPGTVTRIVAGCSKEELTKQKEFHQKHVRFLSKHFYLHTTPDFSHGPKEKESTKYFNKPYGVLDWMQKVLGFPNSTEHEDDIVSIVDPDFLLMRPLRHVFDLSKYHWTNVTDPSKNKVEHGWPIAHAYGHGNSWLKSLKGQLSYVVGQGSPALGVTMVEAEQLYPAGPPYLATGRDMYQLAFHWVKFLPLVHDVFPEFMAEMYAYSIAAAHLELPHLLSKNFMVSSVSAESFDFLRNITREDACVPNIVSSEDQLPQVLHYCQRYALGRWFVGKYKIPTNILACPQLLLREPPHNVGALYDWNLYPNGKDMMDMRNRKTMIVRNGWMMCTLIRSVNEAAAYLKERTCENPNMDKKFIFHDREAFEAALRNRTCPFCSSKPVRQKPVVE